MESNQTCAVTQVIRSPPLLISVTKCPLALPLIFNLAHMWLLFAEGEVIIGEYSPRRSRGEYSPIITEPEANNCFSINTQVIISKKRKKKHFNAKSSSLNIGKTTTGSHFVRRGDYRLIIRDSEPMRARDFV